ncbi:unnamed protein product, partial [Sphacelaria rigidula]
IDVRVWVTQPHLALVEFPMSQKSDVLLLEGERGIYYRWQRLAVPKQVVHMEAAVQGLAAVIVNEYQGAAESRGTRGTAGSGRGARTLVEGLSLSITHNHWLAVNHLDLHACLPLQEPDGG